MERNTDLFFIVTTFFFVSFPLFTHFQNRRWREFCGWRCIMESVTKGFSFKKKNTKYKKNNVVLAIKKKRTDGG